MGNDIERRLEILIGRPRLGVEMQDLNPELGGYFERPSGKGVLVTRVLPDTPAKRAGLKAGDVIIELDGKTVDNADELRDRLDRAEAGPVRVTVLRRGQRQVLSAQLEKQDYRGLMAGREPRVFVPRLGPGAGGTWSFDSRDDLRRQMDDLKRQMDELKEQMQALKDQMEREAPGRR
jgi:membrane-associated protease RseP (regulator of RpoE activity)